MTLVEFIVALEGFNRRESLANHRARMVMTYVKVYGGMGSEEEAHPSNEWPIPYLDDEERIMPITDLEEAKELIKVMLNGTN